MIFLLDVAEFYRFDLKCFLIKGKPKKHNANPIPSFVVGCKSDLDEKKRMVTKYEAQAFAVKHGSRFVSPISFIPNYSLVLNYLARYL